MGQVRAAKTGVRRQAASSATTSTAGKRPARQAIPGQALTVRNRLARDAVQPSLIVGAANDRFEAEADRTADRVLSMTLPSPAAAQASAPTAASASDTGGSSPAPSVGASRQAVRREGLGGQPSTDELAVEPPVPDDQKEPSVGPEEDVKMEGLDAADLAEIEAGEPAGGSDAGADAGGDDAGGAGGGEGAGGDTAAAPEPDVQAKPDLRAKEVSVGAAGGAAPADAARAIRNPGPGRPLPNSQRQFMEPRFGTDFSSVRLHDQSGDRSVARRIGARAFTYGHDVWLGPGEEPGDKRLMAHELTHVVQQSPVLRAQQAEASAATPDVAAAPRRVQRFSVMEKLEPYARKIPGYTLFTVIIGKSPLTGNRVERTASNLIGGLLGLIPGGTDIFDKLKESGALQEAFDWVKGRISAFPITWSRLKGAAEQAWDDFSFLSFSLAPVRRAFKPLLDDLVDYVKETAKQLLEFAVRAALKAAGPFGEKIWAMVAKVRDTIMLVISDPVGFAKNLLSAVVKGFTLFKDNIVEHLKRGVMSWLLGAMQGIEITFPPKLDLKGLLSIAMQLLGLTYQNFRAILVKKLKPNGEKKVSFIEKAIAAIQLFMKEGFTGLWQKLVEYFNVKTIMQTVIGGLNAWLMKTLVVQAISWAASLSNPVGGILRIALAIYKVIETFIQRLEQIREFAESIFSSIGKIAQGNIEEAAKFVEQSMARTVPLIFSFLAAVLNIGGITKAIRDIFKKLQKPAKTVMEKFVGFFVKKAKKFMAKIIKKLNSKRKLPSANFMIGKVKHRFFAKKKGKKVEMFVNPPEQDAEVAGKGVQQVSGQLPAGSPEQKGLNALGAGLQSGSDEAEKAMKNVGKGGGTANEGKDVKAGTAVVTGQGPKLSKGGAAAEGSTQIEAATGGTDLIRLKVGRTELEGNVDLYETLGAAMEGKKENGRPLTFFYERDHLPSQGALKAIQDLLPTLRGGASGAGPGSAAGPAAIVRDGDKPAAEGAGADAGAAGGTLFGLLESRPKVKSPGTGYTTILLYKPHHTAKGTETGHDKRAKKVVADAQGGDLVAPLKAWLMAEVEGDVGKIKNAYSGEELTDVKARVLSGVELIRNKAIEDYGLTGTKGAVPPKPAAAKGDRRSYAFTAKAGAEGPNFALSEGTSGAYKDLNDHAKKGFLDRDHIIDQVFPKKVRHWSLWNIWQHVKGDLQGEIDSLKGQGRKVIGPAKDRRKQLERPSLFPGGSAMRGYTEQGGFAITIFRPVHIGLTGGPRITTLAGAPFKKIADKYKVDAANYVSGRAPTMGSINPDAVTKEARDELLEIFRARTKEHGDRMIELYNQEVPVVVSLNPKAQQAAARKQMLGIVGKVQGAVGTAKTKTEDLFK